MSFARGLFYALLLIAAGAALALYAVANWDRGAQVAGLASQAAPASETASATPIDTAGAAAAASASSSPAAIEERIAALERAVVRAEGSVGRADGLLVAFAARRAVERGLPLGYLEPLLVDRFKDRHEAAVAQLFSAAREPVMLKELVADYERLGPVLREPSADTSLARRIRSGLSNLVTIYPDNQPSPRPRARYERALVDLRLGNVDSALAETMRLPGAERASDWTDKARRYVATQRALDRIEAAALVGREDFATDR